MEKSENPQGVTCLEPVDLHQGVSKQCQQGRVGAYFGYNRRVGTENKTELIGKAIMDKVSMESGSHECT